MKKKSNPAREKWVDELLGKMTIEQKVGQLLVFGHCGPVITPDIVELIKKYHLGGVRISQKFRTMTLYNDVKPGSEPDPITMKSMHAPSGKNRDFSTNKPVTFCSPSEYAASLNRLRDCALDRQLSIPVHFTIDQEGSASDDILSGQRLFPHPMGIAATDDPQMAYHIAVAIGKQVRAVGANMIHSPVLDVNTNPKNPEIGTRAYSDKTDVVTRFALESLRGFQETGLIATGKHFPGRGESMADAHWGLPTVSVDYDTLMNTHLAPYKALIAAGLPAIMTAHSIYPALGVTDLPATLSKRILTEFLRGELGFDGVITTDNMMMGGILKKYEMSEAIIMALEAGCDLALNRDESPLRIRIIENILAAVKQKRLTETMIDEKVERILRMRYDMGLTVDGGKVDAASAGQPIDDKFVIAVANESADKSTLLLRDRGKLLPLDPSKKVFLVEQVFPSQAESNNMYSHPGLLWDEMCKLSDNVISVEIPNIPGEADRKRVMRRIDEADIIVTTNYYYHKAAAAITDLVREIMSSEKPTIVVTNTPYEFAAPEDLPTVITSFNPGGRENLRAVARLIYGKLNASAKLPVKL